MLMKLSVLCNLIVNDWKISFYKARLTVRNKVLVPCLDNLRIRMVKESSPHSETFFR